MTKSQETRRKKLQKQKFDSIITDFRSDVPRTRRELKKLLKEGNDQKDAFLIGAANYYLGVLNFRIGLRSEVLPYALKAVSLFRESQDYDLMARSYNLLGIAYTGLEEYLSAMSAYRESYRIVCRHRGISLKKTSISCNLAESYFQLGDLKTAIRLNIRALDDTFRNDPENHSFIIIAGCNLAEYYELTGEYKKALAILKEVKKSLKFMNDELDECAYDARIASISYATGDTEKGNLWSDKVLAYGEKGVDTYELHRDYIRIALAQISLGEFARAERFIRLLLSYADKTKLTIDKIVACRVQAPYYDALGDNEKALYYHRMLSKCYEERNNEIRSSQLSIHKRSEALNKEVRRFLSQIRQQEKLLEKDPMTGLLNRNALPGVMDEFIKTASAKKKKIGAIFIDVDFFKQYNDYYGHTKGDQIIRAVADACLSEENATARFARYGGDEFFGVMVGYTDKQIVEIATRISERIKAANIPHIKNTPTGKVTLSIGVVNVWLGDEASSSLDIVNYADKALYRAKDTGRNTICARSGDLPGSAGS